MQTIANSGLISSFEPLQVEMTESLNCSLLQSGYESDTLSRLKRVEPIRAWFLY